MSRWTAGQDLIEGQLAQGRLQAVTGAQANGEPWLVKARRTLATAGHIAEADPESAFVLAHDAAPHACVALLAQQGLRPTTSGGHYVVEEAVRAQFGDRFRPFGALRRRRNELEYPAYPGEFAESEEASYAVEQAHALVTAAEKLLEHLGLFR